MGYEEGPSDPNASSDEYVASMISDDWFYNSSLLNVY